MSDLQSLPNGVLGTILARLETKDMLRFKRASKHMYELATHAQFGAQSVNLGGPEVRRVKSAGLIGAQSVPRPRLAAFYSAWQGQVRSVKVLDLSRASRSVEYLSAAKIGFPSLRKLDLSFCKNITIDTVLALRLSPDLHILVMKSVGISAECVRVLCAVVPNLKALDLQDAKINTNGRGVLAPLLGLKDLQYLNLKGIRYNATEAYEEDLEAFLDLERPLSLACLDWSDITIAFEHLGIYLALLLPYLKALELDISFGTEELVHGFGELLKGLVLLEEVTLTVESRMPWLPFIECLYDLTCFLKLTTSTLTEEMAAVLVPLAERLKFLNCNHIGGALDAQFKMLEPLLKNCRRLETFEVERYVVDPSVLQLLCQTKLSTLKFAMSAKDITVALPRCLQSLKVEFFDSSFTFPLCGSELPRFLKKVEIEYTDSSHIDQNIAALLRNCPVVEEVSLHTDVAIPESLEVIATSCRFVKSLALVLDYEPEDALNALMRTRILGLCESPLAKCLLELALGGDYLDDRIVASFVQLTNLHTLSLGFDYEAIQGQLSLDNLVAVLRSLPKLERVSIDTGQLSPVDMWKLRSLGFPVRLVSGN